MHKLKNILFRIIVLFILNVLLIGNAACERGAPIQIENGTDEVLTVYIDEYRIGDVDPGDKVKNDLVFVGQDSYLIKAYNIKGDVVYSHKFSKERLKEIDWKIVIPGS